MVSRVLQATLVAGSLLCLTLETGAATPPTPPSAIRQPTEIKRVAESTAGVEDEAGACTRARRKLWIEGEGWVVRRVTTCR